MTTHPARPEPDIVALVESEIGRAVRDACDRTTSPYFASGLLDRALALLQARLAQVAQHRPDLHDRLADHFDVPTTPGDVSAAVRRYAHAQLERRQELAAPTTGPTILDADVAGAQRLHASADAWHRTPPSSARPPPARPR
ncbi:hypothetical protein [Knoellia aerolata]|uniref:Uncharacterized protein n=1 Tax=Knoellia aerolata DSM 18566 TaxID=1385519 RepID=A0A0A0JYB3_9MICO|nr:hypothetical protein [Knoellia aerolata]KGN41052.1 hypothetical protein N801_09785 [Knoellia aerolata DSM 18566]